MGGPTGRVLQLLSLLQTHRFWPGPELCGRLEVSPRTLRRDVDRLRCLGYPVEATPGVAGGYRLAAGAHLPPLLLDDDEAVAIAVGLRSAAGAAVEGFEATALRAMAKLEQLLPDRLRRRANAVHANVTPLVWGPAAGPRVDAGALAVLAQACRDREEVRFDYQRHDGEQSRRLVEPVQLVMAGRRWYLVGWDVRRAQWRTFRVDRLAEPRLAGVRFGIRTLPAADAAAFVAQSLASLPRPFELTVTVHAGLEEARAALRWADATVAGDGPGRCRARIRADTAEALAVAVAMVAVAHGVQLGDGADGEVARRVGELARRLADAVATPAG